MQARVPSELLLQKFISCLGVRNVSADPAKNEHFRKGWRSGGGEALAVLFPQSLIQAWDALKLCVEHNCIIIMQAANTGLTEGSTPSGNEYDRPVIVINMLAIDNLHLINNAEQVIGFPGTTLHQLEKQLSVEKRAPHSVIGSSCLGASVIGGVANNSGGALIKRGPAYTELSLFAKIDEHGELVLVNHLGIELGDTPKEVLTRLENKEYKQTGLSQGDRLASDKEYVKRLKDIDADTPSRFNADKRRLYEASGCAGKLAVFAVRLDTHPISSQEQTFYIATNDTHELTMLRRKMLSDFDDLPEVAEYMHRDIFDVSEKYGKDTFLAVQYLGTDLLPKMFALKGRFDAIFNKYKWLPRYISDKSMQLIAMCFPSHLPKRILEYRQKYEHHLILKVSNDNIEKTQRFLTQYFDGSEHGSFLVCDKEEAKKAYLHRFAAAGAAIRYHTLFEKSVGDILALDIALRRNDLNWFEKLPAEIDSALEKKLYYGHFFCYVFHQDYILKKGTDAKQIKMMMLKHLNARGAKYPAEHNVGHLYEAEPDLQNFYRELDPTNSFNPGVGKMEKTQRNCACCL
ncbi:D-lactate dehydrogenase [Glaciecola sp. KUL10]|uniref:D-lactate dehydrogenase n=1 Tax=Glaciecola sp. (strain KUL10) TaxID=2161813 RepID=UPI00358FDB2F